MGCEPLLPSLRTAIKRQDMGVRSDFAVRAVRASTAAMIEAPIQFYVTENDDGTAALS